jgi:hypothetical protein
MYKTETLVILLGRNMQNDSGTVKSLVVPPEIKYNYHISSNSTSRYICKRTESRYLNKCLYMNNHSGSIHGSQKAETTQLLIN